MITPEYLNEVVLGTEKAVSRLNEKLIRQIAKRISAVYRSGENPYMPSTVSDMMKVARSGYSIEQVQSLIESELPNIQAEIRTAFYDAAVVIAQYTTGYTEKVGKTVGIEVDLPSGRTVEAMTKDEVKILENAFKRTNAEVRNLTKTTASNVYKDYIQGCDDAFMKVRSGMSVNKAVSQAVDELAKKGITTVSYPSGHTDNIDVAVARAVRTGINQANAEIILQRCASLGIGYVKVSQHLGARVTKENDLTNHSWWQGGVYKLDWTKDPLKQYGDVQVVEPRYTFFQKIKKSLLKKDVYAYPDFIETCGYGNILGIIGVNCRHTFSMWQPDINKVTEEKIDPKENERRYRIEQRMRAYERSIRQIRRRIEAQKGIPLEETSEAALKALENLLKEKAHQYTTFCQINGITPYMERTH